MNQIQNKDHFIKTFTARQKIKDYVTSLYSKLTDDNIEKILTLWTKDFIKGHNPYLDIKEYFYFKYGMLPNYVFLITLTKTQTNHPYLTFCNLNSNEVRFITPFGEATGQVSLDYLEKSIQLGELSKDELNVLYAYIQKNIVNRKNAILNVEKFSLLNCSNIANCHKKMNEISKMRLSLVEKKKLMVHYQAYYQEKAIKFISKYFELLEAKDFSEAFLFLRGSKGKYFGKQRLNTFFKNSKQIVGHLQIFIHLYQVLHLLYEKKQKK